MSPPLHVPVLSWEGFQQVCRAPPLQGPSTRLNAPRFVPLEPHEMPRPGTLLALDAEFVAHAPAKRARRGCACSPQCTEGMFRVHNVDTDKAACMRFRRCS